MERNEDERIAHIAHVQLVCNLNRLSHSNKPAKKTRRKGESRIQDCRKVLHESTVRINVGS
jgi:hypothetical protein